jgi:excisionase family DNA binding protein
MTMVEEVTVQEAARRVHRSPETIRRWIWSGKLPATKRGNTYYIDVMHLQGVAVELNTGAWHSPERELAQEMRDWLDDVHQWRAETLARRRRAVIKSTAADLVIEDRRERR